MSTGPRGGQEAAGGTNASRDGEPKSSCATVIPLLALHLSRHIYALQPSDAVNTLLMPLQDMCLFCFPPARLYHVGPVCKCQSCVHDMQICPSCHGCSNGRQLSSNAATSSSACTCQSARPAAGKRSTACSCCACIQRSSASSYREKCNRA